MGLTLSIMVDHIIGIFIDFVNKFVSSYGLYNTAQSFIIFRLPGAMCQSSPLHVEKQAYWLQSMQGTRGVQLFVTITDTRHLTSTEEYKKKRLMTVEIMDCVGSRDVLRLVDRQTAQADSLNSGSNFANCRIFVLFPSDKLRKVPQIKPKPSPSTLIPIH